MADLTSLPGRLDVTVWHGRTETILLTWPADTLDDTGPWTATVTAAGHAPINLPVTVDEDVMTITVPEEATTPLLHVLATLTLADGDRTVISGTFRTSDTPGPSTIEAAVVIDEQQVTVELVGGLVDAPVQSVNGQTGDVVLAAADVGADVEGAASAVSDDLAAHEGLLVGGGAHGRIVHDWEQSGWDPFTPILMTAHGGQEFETTVSDGRGRITGLNPGDGSHRIAYAREGTLWADGEIRSVIWPPSPNWDGTNSQLGHIHRIVEIEPGVFVAVAVWLSVLAGFGLDWGFLHANGVRFDGTTLNQGPGAAAGFGSTDTASIDRRTGVLGTERFSPFSIDRAIVKPLQQDRFNFLVSGDLLTTANMADTSYHVTDGAIVEVNRELGNQVIYDSPGDVEPWQSVRRGHITPSSRQKRWTPMVLATRVIGGTSTLSPVEAKRWRLGDPEPDWGDPLVQRSTIPADAGVPTLPTGEGLHALWGGHFTDGSWGEYGPVTFTQL